MRKWPYLPQILHLIAVICHNLLHPKGLRPRLGAPFLVCLKLAERRHEETPSLLCKPSGHENPTPGHRLQVQNLGLIRPLALLTLLPLTAAGIDKMALEEVLPKDTLFFAKIENLRQFKAGLSNHPLLDLWEAKDIQKFFSPLTSLAETANLGEQMKEAFDIDIEELQALFPGQVGVMMTNLQFPATDEDAVEFDAAILANYEGDLETLKKIFQASSKEEPSDEEDSNPVIEEEFLDVTLYLQELKPEEGNEGSYHYQYGWALVEDLLVIAEPADLLRETVSRIVEESKNSALSQNPLFIEVQDQVDEAELLLYLNLESLIPNLVQLMGNSSGGLAPTALGISMDRLLEHLGLEVLESVYFSLDLKEEATAIDYGLFYTENRGLLTLLAYQNGDLPQPTFVPESAYTATLSLFSLSELWDNLKILASDLSPLLTVVYTTYLEYLKAEMGVDLQTSIIKNLEDGIVTYSGFPSDFKPTSSISADALTHVYVFSIKERQGFETALEAFKTKLGSAHVLFDERKYLGTSIFSRKETLPLSGGADFLSKPFSYALTDRYLFLCLGSTTLIEAALARIEDEGNNLWEEKEINAVIDKLPSPAAEISYKDFGVLLNSFFTRLVGVQQGLEEKGISLIYCDPSTIPKLKPLPFFLLTKIYREREGLFARARLLSKGE